MGEDPSMIREQIEDTRDRMGETVEALGYKADVPSRAKESITGKVDTVKSKISGATPDTDQVKGGAKQAVGLAQQNPLGLAVGAVAVGFLAGMLVPETTKEHEALGEYADQVKGQVKETAQDALEHGRQVAQETAQSAKDAAQQHGQQVAESAKEQVGAS